MTMENRNETDQVMPKMWNKTRHQCAGILGAFEELAEDIVKE